MRSRLEVSVLLPLVAAVFLCLPAHGQCVYPWDLACDTQIYYDLESNSVYGYSYTYDYLMNGTPVGVSVDLTTPVSYYNFSDPSEYELAQVNILNGDGNGSYDAEATHYAWWDEDGYTHATATANQPIPTGETITGDGWSGGKGIFNMALTGAQTTWVDGSVTEVAPSDGSGGPDTCYVNSVVGGITYAFTAVTGTTWPVTLGNGYGPDYIGYGSFIS